MKIVPILTDAEVKQFCEIDTSVDAKYTDMELIMKGISSVKGKLIHEIDKKKVEELFQEVKKTWLKNK